MSYEKKAPLLFDTKCGRPVWDYLTKDAKDSDEEIKAEAAKILSLVGTWNTNSVVPPAFRLRYAKSANLQISYLRMGAAITLIEALLNYPVLYADHFPKTTIRDGIVTVGIPQDSSERVPLSHDSILRMRAWNTASHEHQLLSCVVQENIKNFRGMSNPPLTGEEVIQRIEGDYDAICDNSRLISEALSTCRARLESQKTQFAHDAEYDVLPEASRRLQLAIDYVLTDVWPELEKFNDSIATGAAEAVNEIKEASGIADQAPNAPPSGSLQYHKPHEGGVQAGGARILRLVPNGLEKQ